MPRSRTCQWKAPWNSAPLSVWIALDPEGELLEDVVDELDRGLLVVAGVDPQHPDAGAVVDRGELVVLLARAADRLEELHVDLDPVAGQRLLVALPTVGRGACSAASRQPVHVEAFEDPPHPRRADRDVVVALQVHRDLARPEVIVLAQVDDLADDLGLGRVRRVQRRRGTVPQAVLAELLVAAEPLVEGLAG